MRLSGSLPGQVFVQGVAQRANNGTYMVRCPPGEALGDGGCRAAFGGQGFHRELQAALSRQGRRWVRCGIKELVEFGGGEPQESLCTYLYPVDVKEHGYLWRCAEVPTACPGLTNSEDLARFNI